MNSATDPQNADAPRLLGRAITVQHYPGVLWCSSPSAAPSKHCGLPALLPLIILGVAVMLFTLTASILFAVS